MNLILIILSILTGHLLQELVGCFVSKMNDSIKESMKVVREFSENQGRKEVFANYKNKLDEEILPFDLIVEKKKRLYFITKILGYFEIFLFSSFTFLLLNHSKDYLEIVKLLGIGISSWIAIKIFGSYQQWSGPVFGRAIFYIFLLGSLINIIGAIIIGLFIFNIKFYLLC